MINQQQGSIEIERLYITCKTFAMGYKESYTVDLKETTEVNPYTNQIIKIGDAKLVDGEDGKFVYSKYKTKQNAFDKVSNQN